MLLSLLLSGLAWLFCLWYSIKHPIIGIPYKERGGGGGEGTTTVTSHTYYYYKIKFPHNSLDPSQTITFYDAFGTILSSVPPYYSFMNYSAGILSVPGTEQNTNIERVSTASYYVFYATSDLVIDYERAEFKISKTLIKTPAQTTVQATFEYLSVITPFRDIASVIDGRWDTQVQSEFFGEPPAGYNYAILDLGSIRQIQAMDIVAGFYRPDDIRKYDVNFNLTIHYSLNGIDYYDISDETHNFDMSGGSSKSFEEKDLGIGFTARYLKLILENVKKIEYGSVYVTVSDTNRSQLIAQGVITENTDNGASVLFRSGSYVVAITEIAIYDNIILKSEATLIPLTTLTKDISLSGLTSGTYPTMISVESTDGFELESGETSRTAYIDNADGTFDAFTYTGVTATDFYGVTGLSEDHSEGDRVVEEIEGDNTYYDYNSLLPHLKDRVYKKPMIDDGMLFSQSQLDYVSKRYLQEFVKNHSKIKVDVLYSPHIEVGQTIRVIDSYNGIDTRYFVDSITDNNGFYSLVLARYPA